MSLLYLSKALMDKDATAVKDLGVLTGQMMFISTEGKYHTHWVDLASYSAVVDMKNIRRYNSTPYDKDSIDNWGRIRRTQFWG